jgi:hypothetical protein
MTSQCRRVLTHLQEIGPLTDGDARLLYSIGHVASRISELRHNHGIPIRTSYIMVRTARGERVRVAEYSLEMKHPGKERA